MENLTHRYLASKSVAVCRCNPVKREGSVQQMAMIIKLPADEMNKRQRWTKICKVFLLLISKAEEHKTLRFKTQPVTNKRCYDTNVVHRNAVTHPRFDWQGQPSLKTWRHALSDRPSMVVKTPSIAQPFANPKVDNHVLGVFVGITGAGEKRQLLKCTTN